MFSAAQAPSVIPVVMATTNTLPLSLTTAGCDCQSCGQFVAFRPCQSDANGNKGHSVAVVGDIHGIFEYMLTISLI